MRLVRHFSTSFKLSVTPTRWIHFEPQKKFVQDVMSFEINYLYGHRLISHGKYYIGPIELVA